MTAIARRTASSAFDATLAASRRAGMAAALRAAAIDALRALGFPTTKNEDWHFTTVAPIAERTSDAARAAEATA